LLDNAPADAEDAEPFSVDQWRDPLFDYIPFSPDNCIFFEVGDYTSLKGLELDAGHGKLIPDFAPDVYEYSVLLYTDQVPEMALRLKPTAAAKGSKIQTGTGEALASGEFSPPYALRVGENRILLTVTSKNSLVARTYMLTVYVLLESMAGYNLAALVPSHGAPPCGHRATCSLSSSKGCSRPSRARLRCAAWFACTAVARFVRGADPLG
jgi:hypothetical protein